MSIESPHTPTRAAVAEVRTTVSNPPLWNPSAAAKWSLLFSPIFGALLHMKNWQAMGEPQKASVSKNWAIATTAFLVLCVILLVAMPESKALDLLSRLAGFVILIAWYYSIGKSQSIIVTARYGNDYPRKGWVKPLSLAVVAFFGFLIVAALVGFFIGILTGLA